MQWSLDFMAKAGTETDRPSGLETKKCSVAEIKHARRTVRSEYGIVRPQNAGSWRGLRKISAELEWFES
jgi:hypothetical protein